MKMNNKTTIKIAVILMLATLLVTFTHCMPSNPLKIENNPQQASFYTPPTSAPKSEEQELNETQVTVGIKNHEQILQTMASLTGVDPQTNNSVMQMYNQVALSLPTGNDVKVFSPTHQIAISKLAAQFCNVLVDTQALRVVVWPNFNFGMAPGAEMSIARRTDAINSVVDAFWMGMVEGDELIDAKMELDALLVQLSTPGTNETNNGALTVKAMKGLCTATLSSAHVILL